MKTGAKVVQIFNLYKFMATFYCLFEQSGTFKNAFRELGHESFDFDILDDYGQTDFRVDLFDDKIMHQVVNNAEVEKATIIMFFPCTYFSPQQILWTRGVSYSQRNCSIHEKLNRSKNNISETNRFYNRLCMWVQLCVHYNVPLIIENPYSPLSFLVRYFPISPSIIDKDRRRLGDKFIKPTMWFFINREPSSNLHLMPTSSCKGESYIASTKYGKERSEISREYAINFIKSFIL